MNKNILRMALNRIIVPNDVSILYTALYFIAVVAMHNRGSFLFILRASYLPSIFDRCDKSILIVVIKRFIQLCFIISILLSWEMLFNTTYLNLLNVAKNITGPILSDYLFIVSCLSFIRRTCLWIVIRKQGKYTVLYSIYCQHMSTKILHLHA